MLHELNKGGTAVNMVVDKASKLGIDVDKMKFDSFSGFEVASSKNSQSGEVRIAHTVQVCNLYG